MLALPASSEELALLIRTAGQEKIPYYVMGRGSNLIVADEGYPGMIVKIGEHMSGIKINGREVSTRAGETLSALSKACADRSLTGLEFASGIPGTVGGGTAMNAGAYGHDMSEVISAVEFVDDRGAIKRMAREKLHFGYRESPFMHHPWIVTEVCFKLSPGDTELIKETMKDLALRRRKTQPLQYPSAGSVFKRPAGAYAGPLIEQAGLKGFRIGNAQVSTLHAGFIINLGGATAGDVIELIRHIQEKVRESSGIWLEPEVRILGAEQCQ